MLSEENAVMSAAEIVCVERGREVSPASGNTDPVALA